MTRQVFLDTETTGLDPRTGDRIVEIGCVEMLGRRLTEQRFHAYLNPQRAVADSERIHGLSDEFLADKPLFSAIAEDFCQFIRDAVVIIHNADFDIGFLDHELGLVGREPMARLCGEVIDTLKEARKLRPGRKNNLDALCVEFGVDNSGRQVHGALLDAELLADVYLAMTRGQNSLAMDFVSPALAARPTSGPRAPLRVLAASAEELVEHQRVLAEIAKASKGNCLWQALEPSSVTQPVT